MSNISRRAVINNYKRKIDSLLIYGKGTDYEKEILEFFRNNMEIVSAKDEYYFTASFKIPHWEEEVEKDEEHAEYSRLCEILESLIPVASLCRSGSNKFYIAIPSDKYIDEKINQLSYVLEELEKWKKAKIE